MLSGSIVKAAEMFKALWITDSAITVNEQFF